MLSQRGAVTFDNLLSPADFQRAGFRLHTALSVHPDSEIDTVWGVQAEPLAEVVSVSASSSHLSGNSSAAALSRRMQQLGLSDIQFSTS